MTYALYGDSRYPYQSRLTWTGSTWAIVSGKAVNTPTLGAELFANGSFAVDASWTKGTGWTIGSGVASHAAGNATTIYQSVGPVGRWIQMVWTLTRTAGTFNAYAGNPTIGVGMSVSRSSSATYTDTVLQRSATLTGFRATDTAAAGTVDNVSAKLLTTASMFATVPTSTPGVIAKAGVTITAGNPAGLVLALDSASTPANYILCFVDGTKCILDKCVGGTITNLINANVTYVAGATMQVSTTISGGSLLVNVTYNGSTVGTQQTVSDAGIVSNTIHGMFSTYSGNSLDNFYLYKQSNNELLAYDSFTRADGVLGYTESYTGPRYYGVGTFENILWGIDVDWDNDGRYSGDNEASYVVDFHSNRGRNGYLSISPDGDADGFEPVRVGTATLILDNTSRRYDPYNTSSDLYPNVQAGRYIRVRVAYGDGVDHVIHGRIKSITPNDNDGESTVSIEIEDGMRQLQNTDTSIPIQSSVRIDEGITQILEDINYPGIFGANIETSTDVMDYWWATKRAASELRDLAQAELGQFFVAADGKATFYSRHHTQGTMDSFTSSDFLKNIDVPMPAEVLRNYIKVYARPRTLQAAGVLWTLQDTPLIAAGGSLTIWASYRHSSSSDNVPALNVTAPVAMTDYIFNSAADGSGTNLTGNFTVTLTDFGTTAKIVIVNNGASSAYPTLLQVQGQAITSPNPSLLIEEDATSQAVYGKALLTLQSDWIQSTALANDFANWLISFMPNPQKFLTVRIEARPDVQFGFELFDQIELTIPRLGVDGVIYRVAGIEHRWMLSNGQAVQTTLTLEPANDLSGYWQFTTTIGETSIFGI